ncbi:CIA30 family protein [Thiomicrorhabdus lithotrophica]|uniref:CIA30 family protein n=1 Tax=Thiomicrorhabdus lithotrophica TaxID=2949997 RepID=A0ABY8C6Q1_9GAMM|nr:CIA30 family protein [Thiomicrorhabdus lithotrophica]WEJ61646.1 CIA30 family protein [Thiomicrorhabdus lithotrophica]
MQQLTLYTNQATDTKHSWKMVSDQVMGGISQGIMQTTENGVNLQGRVSLKNNGGFLQVQWQLSNSISQTELQSYRGIFIEWCSQKNEELELLLKSAQLWMPWQSYRCKATATPEWQMLYIPFELFQPYRTQTRLNPKRINKFSVLAGGKEMDVNVTIRQFGFFKSPTK